MVPNATALRPAFAFESKPNRRADRGSVTDSTTLPVILLLGGGGWYGRGRWY